MDLVYVGYDSSTLHLQAWMCGNQDDTPSKALARLSVVDVMMKLFAEPLLWLCLASMLMGETQGYWKLVTWTIQYPISRATAEWNFK
jgi:hypothetical protein